MILKYKNLIFIIFLFFHLFAFSQTDEKKKCQKDTIIYDGNKIDKPAHFKKNFDLMNFFNFNFKYKKYIDQGFVINIAFIVEKDGSITFHKGKNTPLYDSVLQIIKKLPKIYPAKLKNKKVRSAYYFRVFFCDKKNIIINPFDFVEVLNINIDDYTSDGEVGKIFIREPASPCPPLTDEDRIFDFVQEMPEFPGGKDSMDLFIEKNKKFPNEAYENGIQGRVFVSYIVEIDGSLSEIEIVSNNIFGFGLEEEALRIVKKMPKWIPGKQNGKIVRVKFVLPINFKLSRHK